MSNNNETSSDAYDEDDIRVLEGVEGVRHRPAMYIGDTSNRGLHHLIFEVIDNSVDEAMANRCDSADVILHDDGSVTIIDDGAGIPSDIHPKYGVPTIEVILTKLHSGGKFTDKAYKVSGGLHGVGLSVVSALSEIFFVKSVRKKNVYSQHYVRGVKIEDVQVRPRGPDDVRGTTIRFKPDSTIFNVTTFSYDVLAGRFKELAYLTKGFTISFTDQRSESLIEGEPVKEVYKFDGGLVEFVQHTLGKRSTIVPDAPIFTARGEKDDVVVDVVMTYSDSFQEVIRGFVNNIDTREGGTHVSGFKTALTRTLNDYARHNKLIKDKEPNLRGDDTREGIIAIISVKVPDPLFEGQTKTKLGNSEVDGIVQQVFGPKFRDFLDEQGEFGKSVVQKALVSRRARLAAQKARDLIRKTGTKRVSLPGKLISCSSRNPEERELFIVEGQSAGGTAVKARDSRTQEILFMRGKVLNVEKARLNRILDNEEIRNIITAVGAGMDNEFDLSKVRYGKVIILTDADVDGQHIAILLLTFFYRHMRPLIEEGFLYIARPPLYKVEVPSKLIPGKRGNSSIFLTYDRDREALFRGFQDAGMDVSGIKLNRFKGLGEMNADQLEETVMHVNNRTIDRIVIADATQTEKWVTTLMGDDVSGRKVFIREEVFSEDEQMEFGPFYTNAFHDEEEVDENEDSIDEEIAEIVEKESEYDELFDSNQDLLDQLEEWTSSPKF